MSDLRRTPFYQVLHRPNLFMGGDREIVLLTLVITGGIALIALDVIIMIISFVLWIFCIYWLRRISKNDPQMRQVYTRHVNYNSFYPARSHPLRSQ